MLLGTNLVFANAVVVVMLPPRRSLMRKVLPCESTVSEPHILLVSYVTGRIHIERFLVVGKCSLWLSSCD